MKLTSPTSLVRVAAALVMSASSVALAAGGHHAVDDAAILDTDSCEIESWFSKARGGSRLLHAGAGCRVGPVELGLGADYTREAARAKPAIRCKPSGPLRSMPASTWASRSPR